MKSIKSQSSLEFLFILGIGFSIVLILGGIFITYSNSAKGELDQKQIKNIGNSIMLDAEKLYYLGSGNKVTIKAKFPETINNFTIHHLNISNGTTMIQYDYLNITFSANKLDHNSELFFPKGTFIRLNCTKCYSVNLPGIGNSTNYFNISDFGGGARAISIQAMNDFVSIDFSN